MAAGKRRVLVFLRNVTQTPLDDPTVMHLLTARWGLERACEVGREGSHREIGGVRRERI